MKKISLFQFVLVFALSITSFFAQNKIEGTIKNISGKLTDYVSRPDFPLEYELYKLNFIDIKSKLKAAPTRESGINSSIVITLPGKNNCREQFVIYEVSNFDALLQSKNPDIRSYIGVSKQNPGTIARISLDSRGINVYKYGIGFKSEFLEPITTDGLTYCLYNSQSNVGQNFECSTPADAIMFSPLSKGNIALGIQSNQSYLSTFRLVISCDAEYATYHGGTEASVLAAMNTSLSRVNGVFEKDFAVHLQLIDDTTSVFYYDGATDPYSQGGLNNQLQTTLNSQIGASNYDVGHLFSANGGGGNAGCIGCVCNNSNKGSGYTASTSPVGDNFDIDYVAHELGHQFGANHTFSNNIEGTGVNMEVGSGVTIMGYAGITSQDTHAHSIDIFHSASIQQVQTNVASKTCQITSPLSNVAPVVSAGQSYVIPKLTPFKLEGSATTGTAPDLSYVWEQIDNGSNATTGNNSAASANKATGPNWVNYNVSSEPVRYFPKKETVLTNELTSAGLEVTAEALSAVNRALNFRLTARNNVLGAGLTNFDDVLITVDSSKGPLNVTSQNTNGESWVQNTSQTITWSVNNTNTIIGGDLVDILLSVDGGDNFDIVLASAIPNNGSAIVMAPSLLAENCRVMVKATNNIFFNVNAKVFSLGYSVEIDCEEYVGTSNISVPDGTAPNTQGAIETDEITVVQSGNVDSVSLYLNMTHTYIDDLNIVLKSPSGTEVVVWDRECGSQDNFNLTLEDGGAVLTCTDNMTGVFSPSNPFSAFLGEVASGTWQLQVSDFYNGDTGILNSWKLNLCSKTLTVLEEPIFVLEGFKIYPNPSNGSFTVKFSNIDKDAKVSVFDVHGRLVYNSILGSQLEHQINLSNTAKGIYFVKVSQNGNSQTKKIIID